jgi:hypothetical protein
MQEEKQVTKYQKFITVRVHRSEINEAPYNPRFMPDENDKNLKNIIKTNGLIEALVWNKRSGNLVGGHQRLRQIDILEKSQDYYIDVCQIDVDEVTEVKLNLVLNNTSLMGEYDREKLQMLKQEFPELDFIKDVGFTNQDINFLELESIEKNMTNQKSTVSIDSKKAAEIKNKSRQDYKNFINNNAGNAAEPFRNDNIFTVIFESNTQKWEFLQNINQKETDKFIKYDDFAEFIKEDYRV